MESGILIRGSVLEDSKAIADLSGQLGYPASSEEINVRLEKVISHPENCAFSAVCDGQVIGWIHAFYTLRIETPPFVEIAGLVVDQNNRKKDVGRELVSSVINWAKRFQTTSVRVRSNVMRHEAHDFYRRIGFDEIKDQKIFSFNL